jgi:hypothetical protein
MGGGGGGRGDGIGWVGQGLGPVAAFLARRRARQQSFDAVEGILKEDGVSVPPRPLSRAKIFGIGLLCVLLVGLLIGLVFWELI